MKKIYILGMKLREAQKYVPKDIQNKNKLLIGPDPFLQILGEFRRCMNGMLQF